MKLNKRHLLALCVASLIGMAHAESDAPKAPPKRGPDAAEHCGPHGGWLRGKPDQARMEKFMEQRLNDLHGKLKLNEQQEANWKSFKDKMKPVPPAERPDFAALSKLPTPERLDKMESFRKEHQVRQAAHVAAIKEFYGQLNAEQQKTFDANFMQPPHRPFQGRGPKPEEGRAK